MRAETARWLWLGTACWFAACGTVAEPQLPPPHPASAAAKPLTHADCERLAFESAPTASAFAARRLAADAQLRAGKAWANPTLSPAWENLGLGRMVAEQTVSLGVPLAPLFTRSLQVAAAERDHEAAAADLLRERQRLAISVRTAYDDLVAARERVAVLGQWHALREQELTATRRLAEAGLDSPADVDAAAASVLEAGLALEAAHSAAERQAIAFCFALGFERPLAIELAEPVSECAAAPELEGAVQQALAARPDLRAATARYLAEVERCRLVALRPRFWPTIGGGPRFIGNDTLWVATMDVELPLFDQGGAEVDAQDATLLQAAAEVRKAAQSVAEDVSLALAEQSAALRALREQVEPLVQLRAASVERAERSFAAGEADRHAVAVAAGELLQARLRAIDARLRVAAAGLQSRLALSAPGCEGPAVVAAPSAAR